MQDAIAIFAEAGWREDAVWLGPLALEVFKDADRDTTEFILGDCDRHNIEVIARSLPEAGDRDRDRAMLIAFARLCGCGGKAAGLWHMATSVEESPCPTWVPSDLEECRKIAAEFLADRPHAKGADFEGTLVRFGWPGEYETDADLSNLLVLCARGMIGRGRQLSFHELPIVVRLMHVLVDAAGLDLTKVINESAVVAAGVPSRGPDPRAEIQLRVPETPELKPDSMKDARSLSNWVMGLGPRAVRLFFPEFQKWKNDRYAGAMALGVRDALERWLLWAAGHPTMFLEGGPLLAEATRPYFDLLHERCSRGSPEQAPAARRAWLWFARCTFRADPNSWSALQDDVRASVLRAANEDIARARKLFSRASPRPLKGEEREKVLRELMKTGETLPDLTPAEMLQGRGVLLPADTDASLEEKQRAPWEEFKWESDHLQTCLMLLYRLGGVWRGLKPMLLAWRSLQTPGVARDLRYWDESDRVPPPSPWCDLFAWPINLFNVDVGREQSNDADLTHLRGELATFCLERLVDRWSHSERALAKRENRPRTNEDMIERSPAWRYCYIRAVGALCINPEGKGHRVLRIASEIDPEPEVREAAKHGYQQLRRKVGIPEGVSPRRAILTALWWIRQAHLLGLEIQPDPDGAQRTRIKELTRTMETERADELAFPEQV